jgi:hypothetical protein
MNTNAVRKWTKEEIEACEGPILPPLTSEEESYRRGYCHGFIAAQRTTVTLKEIYAWRNSREESVAPGSQFDKKYFNINNNFGFDKQIPELETKD